MAGGEATGGHTPCEGAFCEGVAARILPGGEAWFRLHDAAQAQGALVAGGVPGDVAAIRLTGKRRGVWRGEIAALHSAGEGRVTPPCAHADACGGCALQPLAPERHAALKSAWVRQAFEAFIEPETEWQPVSAAPLPHARRRVRWHVAEEGRRVGFRQRAGHAVAAADGCMVATPGLREIRDLVTQTLRKFPSGALPRSIQAVELSDGMHVVFEGGAALPSACWLPAEAGGKALCWWRRDEPGMPARPLDASRWPVRALHDRVPAGKEWIALAIGPDDFVQGQAQGNHALLRQIQAWASGAGFVVDLFCGAGNLSLPLAAASGAHVLGADANAASVRAANRNAKALKLDAAFHRVDLFRELPGGEFAGADVMLLDPPRAGAKMLCKAMARLCPKRLVMVSCDVASGARDAALLARQGWRLRALRALDLFAWSGHVETISLWERR